MMNFPLKLLQAHTNGSWGTARLTRRACLRLPHARYPSTRILFNHLSDPDTDAHNHTIAVYL